MDREPSGTIADVPLLEQIDWIISECNQFGTEVIPSTEYDSTCSVFTYKGFLIDKHFVIKVVTKALESEVENEKTIDACFSYLAQGFRGRKNIEDLFNYFGIPEASRGALRTPEIESLLAYRPKVDG